MRPSEEQRRELGGEDGDLPLDKKDMPALMISGLLVVGLPCLLLILLIVGITLLFFGR